MAKHWLIQAVRRDAITEEIDGVQRPKTVPPGIGAKLMKRHPNEWRVLSREIEVADTIQPGTGPAVEWFEPKNFDDFIKEWTTPTKKGQTKKETV